MQDIHINDIKIGSSHHPFIIAEMSGNHSQSLNRVFEIVETAAKTGVHALKIQTYTRDAMTLNTFRLFNSLAVKTAAKLFNI